jgi:hypothetical protein
MIHRRRLVNSLAAHNKYNKLELPRAWKPSGSLNLRHLVREKKPSLVFIMETKMHHNRLEFLKSKLGIENLFRVDSVGKGGGLCLLWKNEVDVKNQNYSRRHINAEVTSEVGERVEINLFLWQPRSCKKKGVLGLVVAPIFLHSITMALCRQF